MSPRALALLLMCAHVCAQDLRIGVVEQEPVAAQRLAAAVEAALQEGAALVAPVEPDEPLAVPAHVCAQAGEEVAGVVSGGSARAAALGAAAAARAGLPLLLVAPAPADASWEALAMYPHPDVLAMACADLCEAKGWSSAVLLHEGSAAGAAGVAPDAARLTLLPRQLPPPHEEALLRNLLLILKKSGATNFIIWCSAECAVRVLDAAQRVGLLAARHSYVVLTLDLHTQPTADFSHGGANITTFQLYDLNSTEVTSTIEAWSAAYARRLGDEEDASSASEAPPVALLLAYDASRLVAETWQRLQLPAAGAGDCAAGTGAFHADTVLNYVRSEEWAGGAAWEADGARRDVRLRVVELARGGALTHVALWAPRSAVVWQRPVVHTAPPPQDSMTNRTFTVLIAINDPYVMEKKSTERLSGNDRYEGFCIELIDQLAKLLQFNYTFVEQEDGDYGKYNNITRQWTGMMRRLRDDPDIDFAITDLTITAERERGVDFTTPFMNLGISILFHTPLPPEPELFAFLLPFSNGVWLCLGFAYLGSSLVLYVVGRLCPEEWQNPYPCVEDPPALENQFTLANALWFNLGAVLLQGSEIAPVAYGTRAVASMWWLFALVITSSYTANLATLLAKTTSTELIHNVQELAENEHGITYGAKLGGSTYTFFEQSQNPLYQKMFQQMRSQKMPEKNDIGIQKVVEGNYAFLMESTSIEYTIERNCETTKIGDLLDSKGYGIAMKKNSAYRNSMNLALLNLQEAGVLREMKHKWWKEMHGGGACNTVEDRESSELRIQNFFGLFLVLIVGCVLGVLLSCCDLAWAAARHPRDPAAPYFARFWQELRFVFRFEQSEKPVQGPLIESLPSSAHTGSAEPEPEPEEEATPEPPRAASQQPRARRRSSMHAASVRLARHATRRDSTPVKHDS
ncbi:glutamate receptor ionotropic, kainate 2-like [Ostrinia nubilalis]|uniref:glutamate receptor ionotropic, kainate 2-like n=1 Tax=Ostrinia nubilalis TaxID=29057 RepID=UPI00308234D5